MRYLTIKVEGDPIPKGRPRLGRRGNIITPERTRRHERALSAAAIDAVIAEDWELPEKHEPIALEAQFCFKMPKSWSKGKRDQMRGCPCCKTPDLDNLVKVCDAFNRTGIWHDDAQVCSISAEKIWGDEGFSIFTVIVL